MKKLLALFPLLFLTLLLPHPLSATTWDEPWHEDVVKNADDFVLATVISNDEEKGPKIKVLFSEKGRQYPKQIEITGFYLLDLCSSSAGHGPEFHFDGVDSCFFFLKSENGKYKIATPTTGFAVVKNGQVFATYRHSYHQALVPVGIYKMTQGFIFRHYQHIAFNPQPAIDYAKEHLAKPPAGMEKEDLDLFFKQHVSLECIYHLELDGFETLIVPHLNSTINFHSQISAARALTFYKTSSAHLALFQAISNPQGDVFVKVICLGTLLKNPPSKEMKSEFESLLEGISTEEADFGGNIMDPRVCTRLSNPKKLLTELLSKM